MSNTQLRPTSFTLRQNVDVLLETEDALHRALVVWKGVFLTVQRQEQVGVVGCGSVAAAWTEVQRQLAALQTTAAEFTAL
jgi:hypothetical protein